MQESTGKYGDVGSGLRSTHVRDELLTFELTDIAEFDQMSVYVLNPVFICGLFIFY